MGALGWAISAGSLGTIAAAVWGYVQLKFRQGAERELKLQQAFATNLKKERDAAWEGRQHDSKRLEAIIESRNKEIAGLESQLRAVAGVRASTIGDTDGGASVVLSQPGATASGGDIDV